MRAGASSISAFRRPVPRRRAHGQHCLGELEILGLSRSCRARGTACVNGLGGRPVRAPARGAPVFGKARTSRASRGSGRGGERLALSGLTGFLPSVPSCYNSRSDDRVVSKEGIGSHRDRSANFDIHALIQPPTGSPERWRGQTSAGDRGTAFIHGTHSRQCLFTKLCAPASTVKLGYRRLR